MTGDMHQTVYEYELQTYTFVLCRAEYSSRITFIPSSGLRNEAEEYQNETD